MKRKIVAVAALVLLAACSREQTEQKVSATSQTVASKTKGAADDVTAPFGKSGAADNNQAGREQQRFDQQWRQLQSFRQQQAQQAAQQTAQQTPTAQQPAGFRFVTGVKESFKAATPESINAAPVNAPITGDMRGPSVLRAQVYLDRIHFSVGAIDGRWGRNSAITVWWYQRARGIPESGDLDEQTYKKLAAEAGYAPVIVKHQLSADDVKGPFVQIPDDVYEKAKLDCLCYQSLREKLAERFHVTEDFIEQLNPDVKFADVQAGTTINVPNVPEPMTADLHDVAKIIISISGNSFNGFDSNGSVVFHAPTTLGAGYDPSPTETLHVTRIVPMPQFHYDPTLYHEVADSEPDAQLPAGPNTPVGIVWMALSKPHYGIHGTPDPESIGYASSHGCVRLTNWDAQEVEHRISEGTEVSFVDVRAKGMPDVAKK